MEVGTSWGIAAHKSHDMLLLLHSLVVIEKSVFINKYKISNRQQQVIDD